MGHSLPRSQARRASEGPISRGKRRRRDKEDASRRRRIMRAIIAPLRPERPEITRFIAANSRRMHSRGLCRGLSKRRPHVRCAQSTMKTVAALSLSIPLLPPYF